MRRPLLVVLPLLALLGAARPAGAANVALFFRSGLRRHGDRRHGRGVQPAAGPHGLYYFFELMGRGFFALLVFAGLVAFVREPAAAALAGRNEPCPCGSGRKFKRCHGR